MQLGQEMGYGGFPIVEDGRLVGMVTESDIVRIMTRVLGVRGKGKRIDIKANKDFGNMRRIMDILDSKKTVLLSLMTLQPEENNDWMIFIRISTDDAGPIADELKSAGFNVTYVG
jgi:acetoin utilization protein AcuB